jgi:hypothetical protein
MTRDEYSKALIETDTSELQKYRREKKREKEFQELKRDVDDIKACINSLNATIRKIEAKV